MTDDTSTLNPCADEAREKWGDTEAFKQSEINVKKMGKEGLKRVLAENEQIINDISVWMKEGADPKSDTVQKLIAKHYNGLRAFYEPNPALYQGLAEMYVADPRFKQNYEKVATGLAEYMKEGMIFFANNTILN